MAAKSISQRPPVKLVGARKDSVQATELKAELRWPEHSYLFWAPVERWDVARESPGQTLICMFGLQKKSNDLEVLKMFKIPRSVSTSLMVSGVGQLVQVLLEALQRLLGRFDVDELGFVSVNKDSVFVEYFGVDRVVAVETGASEEVVSREVVMGRKVEFLARRHNGLLSFVQFASVPGLFNGRIVQDWQMVNAFS